MGPPASTIATVEVALTRTVMDTDGVSSALAKMADAISEAETLAPVAIVGIRRGGEHVARRLVKLIADKTLLVP